MATLTLTGNAGRIWKMGHALETALSGESSENQVITVVINDNWTVTLPSGTVIGPV